MRKVLSDQVLSALVQLQVDGNNIKQVSNFCYLGFLEADSTQDFRRRRVWSGMVCFLEARKPVEEGHCPHGHQAEVLPDNLSINPVVRLWVLGLTQHLKLSINAFATSCYRIKLGIKRIERGLTASLTPRSTEESENKSPTTGLYRPKASTDLPRTSPIRMDPREPAHRYTLYHPPHRGGRPGQQSIRFPK